MADIRTKNYKYGTQFPLNCHEGQVTVAQLTHSFTAAEISALAINERVLLAKNLDASIVADKVEILLADVDAGADLGMDLVAYATGTTTELGDIAAGVVASGAAADSDNELDIEDQQAFLSGNYDIALKRSDLNGALTGQAGDLKVIFQFVRTNRDLGEVLNEDIADGVNGGVQSVVGN